MNKRKAVFAGILIIITIGFIVPQHLKMPVSGATSADYNPASFWYYPWGKSVTHKGVDIFAKKDTKVYAATKGIVLYSGPLSRGGNVVLVLGPKWRLHYFAHLHQITTTPFSYVNHGKMIGTVGDSGNAAGKPPHLHYSLMTLFPYPWRIDSAKQGWKKMFYLNPIHYL